MDGRPISGSSAPNDDREERGKALLSTSSSGFERTTYKNDTFALDLLDGDATAVTDHSTGTFANAYGAQGDAAELSSLRTAVAAGHDAKLALEADVARLGAERVGLARALLAPIERLLMLAVFEEQRAADNPLLQALRTAIRRFECALAEHGFVVIDPRVGHAFDPGSMQLASKGPVSRCSASVTSDLAVLECLRKGFRDEKSGEVVLRATVTTGTAALINAQSLRGPGPPAPSSEGSARTGSAEPSAAPGVATADGPASPGRAVVHEVQKEDTLEGLALRYRVAPSAILRLNRLSSALALHSKPTLLIPPPRVQPQQSRPPAPAARPRAAGNEEARWDARGSGRPSEQSGWGLFLRSVAARVLYGKQATAPARPLSHHEMAGVGALLLAEDE